MTFQQDSQRSCRAFDKFTAPALRRAGARTIIPTEPIDGAYSSEIASLLDCRAGIDGLIVDAGDWAHFYASRVQFGRNYGTITMRRSRPSGAPTEYDKLQCARQVQAPMPTFHVQTYVDADGQAATVAIVETLTLLRYIEKHLNQWLMTDTGETFYYAPFAELAAQVYRVDSAGVVEDVTQKAANFSAA